jgi:periplasmic divalent cation tolerance protein
MKEKYFLVLCTCPDEAVAQSIARTLVLEGLAACVNRVTGLRSTYAWEGSLHDDPEVLLLAKTTGVQLANLSARIEALHPYDLPEVVAVEIGGGSERYLAWIGQSVTQPE